MLTAPPVTHVIFDFDGLLVDTEPVFTRANQEMFSRFGKTFSMELKCKTMGMKNMEAIQYMIDSVGISNLITPEAYAKDYNDLLDAGFLEAAALPGARKLVEHFVSKGVPVAICTGSCSRTFKIKEEKHREWTDLIPIKVMTGDDPAVKKGKPHPDGFLHTMTRFATPPLSTAHVLVFEDAPNGVEAALAAGMQCVMVPDTNTFKPDDGFRGRVNEVLASLEDFKPECFGLPGF